MNGSSIVLWGFAATIVLSITMAGSQRLGYTRMSIPFLLGTMVTPNRDRAMFLGLLVHMVNGWLYALSRAGIARRGGSAPRLGSCTGCLFSRSAC